MSGMQVFYNFEALNNALVQIKAQNATVGFVPTMGALHSGHLSLIDFALRENNWVVLSIFVNPTQFNNTLDFDTYPRTVESDLHILKSYPENVLIFVPETKDIYPNGLVSEHFDFRGIENEMEGRFRPGHFDGVGTVLKSFFSLIQPTHAYFGEKDFQQLQIVKKLVEIEKLPVKIVGCPILREPNGLAMSSRNKRLTKSQFEEASVIYKALQTVKKEFGTKNAQEIAQWVENEFKNNKFIELEYFEISEEETLKPIDRKENHKKYRAFIAVFIDEVRLIDNIALN
jgi:pantoate--beta-alanine ligase